MYFGMSEITTIFWGQMSFPDRSPWFRLVRIWDMPDEWREWQICHEDATRKSPWRCFSERYVKKIKYICKTDKIDT